LNTILKSLLKVYYNIEKLVFFSSISHCLNSCSCYKYHKVFNCHLIICCTSEKGYHILHVKQTIWYQKPRLKPVNHWFQSPRNKWKNLSPVLSWHLLVECCNSAGIGKTHSKPFQEGSPSGNWWNGLGLKRIRDPKSMYFVQLCYKYSQFRPSIWLGV